MALDRQSIEKNDFPMGRRGYDPEAVDAHLKEIAEEVEELKRSGGGSGSSLAASAGEQVKAIVDAAESTAAQIRADAERESKKILADARRELKKARDTAAGQASAQVAKVSDATASLLQRIQALDQEVDGVLETLRTGATKLSADLRELQGSLSQVTGAVTPAEAGEAGVASTVSAAAGEEEESEAQDTRAAEPAEATPAATVEVTAAEAVAVVGGDADLEGARLIALNMALNGNPREDVDRYLAENFDLADRDVLLDEVYASVEG